METLTSSQINKANDLLEAILIELQSYFEHPISSDLLQIHDNGIKLLLKWYPTFSMILRTMLTYYNYQLLSNQMFNKAILPLGCFVLNCEKSLFNSV